MTSGSQGEANNLLLALLGQKDENFTTEAFVHLLRHLQVHQARLACAILDLLTKGSLTFTVDDCSTLVVKTQCNFAMGRPDVVIEGPQHFLILEVKVESGLGDDQLDKYRMLVDKSEKRHRCLVLLSRYHVDQAEAAKADFRCRWFEVGRLLKGAPVESDDPTSRFLVQQFCEFLYRRGMAVEKVSSELVPGVQSLLRLMDMVDEALVAAGTSGKKLGSGDECKGRYFTVDGRGCWSGVWYASPQVLIFEVHKVEEGPARAAGFPRFEPHEKGTYKALRELPLHEDEFFDLSAEKQQLRIEQFVRESVDAVRAIPRAG